MNRLYRERQSQIISSLVEGNSIRSTERMTETHRNTIMRLLVSVGGRCEKIMNERMRNLPCRRIQVDEIWTYVQKKQRHMTNTDDPSRAGDQWTFVAIDPETKIVPSFLIGKRNLETATTFMVDLSERLANRVQISSNALRAYVEATEQAFGANVDYGQIVKIYEAEPIGPGLYSPPAVIDTERTVITGKPIQEHISTSIVERQN